MYGVQSAFTVVNEVISPGSLQLKILVGEEFFKIALNDVHLLEYDYRVGGLEDVNLLRIMGDIILYSVAPTMISP